MLNMLITETLENKEYFSMIECILADYLLIQKDKIENQSAHFIAKELYTVPSTITRFAQKLGFSGFNEFKKAYVKELSYLSSHFHTINPNYPFDYQDESIVIANKIGSLYKEVIDDTLSLISNDELEKIISLLKNAGKIFVCSAGVQADLAETFKDKMLKIGKDVSVDARMDEAFYRASFCDMNSVCIIISYSGETDTILRTARKLKERRVPMIAITTYGENTLAKLCDYHLFVSTREKLIQNLGNFSMNISTLCLLDILYVNIFNEDFQHNFENKVAASLGFEQHRKSKNPLIKDEIEENHATVLQSDKQ